jgi:hypothetical protein
MPVQPLLVTAVMFVQQLLIIRLGCRPTAPLVITRRWPLL